MQMEKKMEEEKNFMKMVKLNLKENIYMDIKKEERDILMENQNMKEDIFQELNGLEKDMMKMVMKHMN